MINVIFEIGFKIVNGTNKIGDSPIKFTSVAKLKKHNNIAIPAHTCTVFITKTISDLVTATFDARLLTLSILASPVPFPRLTNAM